MSARCVQEVLVTNALSFTAPVTPPNTITAGLIEVTNGSWSSPAGARSVAVLVDSATVPLPVTITVGANTVTRTSAGFSWSWSVDGESSKFGAGAITVVATGVSRAIIGWTI